MANNRNVYQQTSTVSIPRESLLEIAGMISLSETDFRVLFCLLTELNGYTEPKTMKVDYKDPKNYKKIDKKQIAEYLNIKKKQVDKSIKSLEELQLLEKGSSETIENGYRFMF